MAALHIIVDPLTVLPTEEDVSKIYTAKVRYEAAQKLPDKDAWNKTHFNETPWGIAYNVSQKKYAGKVAIARQKGKPIPDAPRELVLKYFITAIALDWQELIDQLKRTLRNWDYSTGAIRYIANDIWLNAKYLPLIANTCAKITSKPVVEQLKNNVAAELTEAIEKHTSLNNKLFTKDGLLKDKVRNKMLEIVDEFLADLKEQDIKIKVNDILLIGSNASYNYTKDSDIDLHIIANAKAVNYSAEIGNALYSAYRSIFNKRLDITIYDIPVEIFVELENSARVSNGVYSVKKNKWVKKPVQEDIPEYDKEALEKLVSKWQEKCEKLITDIKADKLNDEKKVVKMLEDIYDKLRKKGVAKSEYSVENLAFKELRNKGYLDKLKDYRNELTSKRLSLEERFDRSRKFEIYNELTRITGTNPIIQDNGTFYIYNIKESVIGNAITELRKLPYITEATLYNNGKYDFSQMQRTQLPARYYDIKGTISFD